MSKNGFPQAVYDFRVSNGSETAFFTEGPSMTRQEFADECDINKLMERYEGHVVGGPGNLAPMTPMYVDFVSMPKTLMEFSDFMEQASSAFMSLPAVVRKEFDNDARAFVEFASAPGNLEQMRSWGLAPPAEAPKETPASAAAAAPASPTAPLGPSAQGST